MKTMPSSHQRRLPFLRGAALAVPATLAAALALLSLPACTDEVLSPAESDPASLLAADVVQRPFAISESWDASDLDFTSACIAEVPDPAAPGSYVQVILGQIHARGTATHWGQHAIDVYTSACDWDEEFAALDVRGPWQAVVASGDTVRGVYAAYGTFGPAGADFVGSVQIQGGTGRFLGATGESSLYTHDEPDGSGWLWGSGWIAY